MIVKSPPWSVPWVAVRVLAGSVLSCAVWAQAPRSEPPARPTISQALDAAWSRSIEAAESQGRQRRAQADQAVASSWLAAPPVLEATQREGRGAGRETEVGVSLPIWRPGQRQRSGDAAQAEAQWAEASQRAARWRLAAQVRESAARLLAAENDLQQAAVQRRLLDELAVDVDRRVAAGDLASVDAMAARAELLAQREQEREAQQSLEAQRAAWLLLTGLAAPPALEDAAAAPMPAPSPSFDAHPEARLAEITVERAQRRLALAQAQRGAPPEIGIGMRQERPGLGQPQQNSVALSLRLPFGDTAHSEPQLAAALAEQDLALTLRDRTRAQLYAELELARSALSAATTRTAAELERSALLRERARLLDKSYRAGETALPELLRALAAASQADAALARQRAAETHARARVQRASGLLP